MSPPGRPKRESLERQREGSAVTAHNRSEAVLPERTARRAAQ
jgi:hypothetical protein